MTGIQPGDAKFYKSERMHDFSDGGGRMTNTELPSGVQNELFPILSRMDVTYGRVNLRKLYAAVRSAILDTYFGAHSIITAPPENPKVSCVLFSTGSDFDTRDAARDRIESYVVAGPLARMRLYGNQIVGQQAILCYQRPEEPLPDVGEVFVLSVEAAGHTPAQQYVRITDVTHEVRTFQDGGGEFQRRVLTLKIGAPLGQTFQAGEVSRLSVDNNVTKLRNTLVADASRYYGVQPLSEAASAGALSLRVASVYAPLVPSTRRETAVSLAQIAGALRLAAAGVSTGFAATGTQIGGTNYRFILPRPVTPGTLAGRIGDTVFADDGAGGINISAGSGSIEYESGVVNIEGIGLGSDGVVSNCSYVPAVLASQPAHTRQIPITLGSRGTVYAETLLPIPAPGTLIVDYRAFGKWYRLRDNGVGELVANDPSEGSGSIDYVTGACIVSLGALPDVDSAVLFAWGSPAHYVILAGGTTDAGTTLDLRFTLENTPVIPESLEITYPVGGTPRTATDSSGNGNIVGTGVAGTINYATGEIRLAFSTPPDCAALLDVDYSWRDGDGLFSGTTATIVDGQFTVPGAPPFRNGGRMTFSTSAVGKVPAPLTLNGYITAGGQVRVSGHKDGLTVPDQPVGSFNAETGVVTLTNAVSVSYRKWQPGSLLTWTNESQQAQILTVSNIQVERDTEAYDPNAVTEHISPSEIGLTLDLTATTGYPIVAGSVLFDATGKRYIDRNGTLYTDVSPITGSGLVAGSINYGTGIATLNFWGDNAAVNRTVTACLAQYGDWTAVDAFFRTAGSPIRPASLFVQATAEDGTLITGTSDENGTITGTLMRGTVEQTMGVVAVEFGKLVGGDWEPVEVLPGTLRYNSVVIANLPLDPQILGLDPVRLPSDGRVPIFRPGDVVVIHHTAETVVAEPVAGATYSVGRTHVAVIEVLDADGEPLAAEDYAADLAAGEITLSAEYDGEGAITIRNRIEHMTVLADVQINGQIELSSQLPHSYPEGSYVSSALLHGDLLARASAVWDQQTWTGVWSDSLIGSEAAATYNDLTHPVEVNSKGTVRERWRLHFTSATNFQIIGEQSGIIGTGNTGSDVAPINGATGEPYFILRAAGFGSGWAAGNNIRFNTFGPSAPVWCVRTTLAGAALTGDEFGLEIRGDVA